MSGWVAVCSWRARQQQRGDLLSQWMGSSWKDVPSGTNQTRRRRRIRPAPEQTKRPRASIKTIYSSRARPWLLLRWRSQYVSYGNQGTAHREPSLPADRTLAQACLRLVLAQVCVQADLRRCLTCWVLWAVECSFISYIPSRLARLHFSRLCVARDLGWCDHDYPRWGEHTPANTPTIPPCSTHRFL